MTPGNHFDLPSVTTAEEEAAREREYWGFETECIQFAQRYGWPAALSAMSRAMKEQLDLPLPTAMDQVRRG